MQTTENNSNYTFTNKTRNITFGLMAVGLISMVAGYITDTEPVAHHGSAVADHSEHYSHNRFWANLLVNGWFYMGIGLLATFFMALQYAAEVAWSVAVKRVYEAISSYLPVGAVIMFLILLAGQFHAHHLYHWMDPAVYDPTSPHYDEVIDGKGAYFTPWFFWLRTILYLVVWC
nr:hypothetical protein [Bacteroidota bacterium]